MDRPLDDVWKHLEGNQVFDDITEINRGELDEANRPFGKCWPCQHFVDNALINESPSTAVCCKDCDAYKESGL